MLKTCLFDAKKKQLRHFMFLLREFLFINNEKHVLTLQKRFGLDNEYPEIINNVDRFLLTYSQANSEKKIFTFLQNQKKWSR